MNGEETFLTFEKLSHVGLSKVSSGANPIKHWWSDFFVVQWAAIFYLFLPLKSKRKVNYIVFFYKKREKLVAHDALWPIL